MRLWEVNRPGDDHLLRCALISPNINF